MTDCREAELIKCIDLLRKACWRQWNGRHQECYDALQQLDIVLAKLPDLSDQPRCREAEGEDAAVKRILKNHNCTEFEKSAPGKYFIESNEAERIFREAFRAGRSQPIEGFHRDGCTCPHCEDARNERENAGWDGSHAVGCPCGKCTPNAERKEQMTEAERKHMSQCCHWVHAGEDNPNGSRCQECAHIYEKFSRFQAQGKEGVVNYNSQHECTFMGRPSMCSVCGKWNPTQPVETISKPPDRKEQMTAEQYEAERKRLIAECKKVCYGCRGAVADSHEWNDPWWAVECANTCHEACRPITKQIAALDSRFQAQGKEPKWTSANFIAYPKHWPPHAPTNGEPCDMADGPCCCGGWHRIDEWKGLAEKYGPHDKPQPPPASDDEPLGKMYERVTPIPNEAEKIVIQAGLNTYLPGQCARLVEKGIALGRSQVLAEERVNRIIREFQAARKDQPWQVGEPILRDFVEHLKRGGE